MDMNRRCNNKNVKSYPNYCGRGIKICARWRDFANFLADMGQRPPGMELDRINNDGDYEPGNCRWADLRTQARNKRSVRPITFGGRTQLLSDWATELGINLTTISMRLDVYGWSVERALTEKVAKRKERELCV